MVSLTDKFHACHRHFTDIISFLIVYFFSNFKHAFVLQESQNFVRDLSGFEHINSILFPLKLSENLTFLRFLGRREYLIYLNLSISVFSRKVFLFAQGGGGVDSNSNTLKMSSKVWMQSMTCLSEVPNSNQIC